MTEKLEDLARRVAELEARLAGGQPPLDPETFWMLEGVRRDLAEHGTEGLVAFAGSWQREVDGEPWAVEWQQAQSIPELLDRDPDAPAKALAALGHPVRLELLRRVLDGIHTTHELAETEGLGTTGQLHHHLRILVTAGWLRTRRRGEYEVPAARVIPVLVIVAAAGS